MCATKGLLGNLLLDSVVFFLRHASILKAFDTEIRFPKNHLTLKSFSLKIL